MQWGQQVTGQAGDRAAHLLNSGAVDRLVVNDDRRAYIVEGPRTMLGAGASLGMSYRVLARTYRSNTFDEVVGQDTIGTTLKNAITSGRVHHGYLFTGTRGVGKTSMARILAKALNCLAQDAPTTTPCCECDSCLAVSIGEDVDVVEIDAASNTGVDNIRELRGNATLRPARSRFKIYIVDEVHMLSTGAFNALLKTLEEPPSHVKFVLATTEAQKVPATIQSRCQRFDFRAIDAVAIADHLRRVVDAEGIETEDMVLRRIARLAHGSMRDALSLLDKVLSYGASRLTGEVIDEVIPPPHDELAFAVLEFVAQRDAAGALRALNTALQSGRTVDRFCDHLIEHLRTLMLLQVCGDETDLVDVSSSQRPALAEQAKKFDAPTYVYMITLLEELRRSAKSSGASRALADAAVVRLAMSHQFTDVGDLLRRLDGGAPPKTAASSPPGGSKKKEVSRPAIADVGTAADARPPEPLQASQPAPTSSEATPAALAPPPVQLSSAERERIDRDPLVQRVTQAVEGRLLSIRRVRQAEQPNRSGDETVEELTEQPEAVEES